MPSYNTGTTKTVGNSGTPSGTVTIPAGVLSGDVILVLVMCFTTATGTLTAALSSTGTAPSPLVPTQTASGGSIQVASRIFSVAAGSADPGATLTFSASGGSGGSYWFNVGLVSYTGFTGVDISAGTEFYSGSANGTTTTPSTSTGQDGDWQVQFLGVAPNNGNNFTVPGTLTQREAITSSGNAGLLLEIADSNGSVGSAGTGIGGTTWTCGSTNNQTWSTSFTAGLKPPGAPPATALATVPQIPHPLWHEMLEIAYSRADWQAQGVATPVRQHLRLMDGAAGRPGNGPATAAGSGSNINGTLFYTTQGGCWFEGFWWWVCPSGSQSVSPQEFALWACSAVSTSGYVIPGTAVTSGTLTSGWNWIPLPQPVQLSLYNAYAAVTAVSGTYPSTGGEFSTTYPGGISNGFLASPSDTGGANPVPFFGNGLTISGTNPAQALPTGNGSTGTSYWLDVQVTNMPPASFQGSFRLQPNMYDGDQVTEQDAAAAYIVGTAAMVNEPAVLNAMWYLVSGGMGASGNQWATSADVWDVLTGQRLATQPDPVWINGVTGQVDGQSNNPRWVYCTFPGIPAVLPANRMMYFTVYNGNGSPNGWSAKALGFWQPVAGSAGGRGTPTGTYQSTPPGWNGITNGLLSAPTTPLAPDIQDYGNPSVIEPGQSVFATGPPNQIPNRYVSPLFQHYFVGPEVTPASTYFASAPVEPQPVPHPLWDQLLEVAAYRAAGQPPPAPPLVGAASLSGAGSLTVPGVTLGYAAALSGAGALAETAALGYSAPLSGTGTLASTVTLGYAAALSGAGGLTAAVTLGYAAVLSGTGLLAVPGVVLGYSADLAGAGSMAVPGVVLGYTAPLTGAGTLQAGGTISGQYAGAAALSGAGALTAAVTLGYAAALSGAGSLTVPWILGPSAAMSGAGTLAGAWILGPAAVLSGTGLLTATPAGALSATAVLTGTGLLTAAGLLVTPFPFTGLWLAGLLSPRYRARPLSRRWKARIMQFEPISALSVEYIPVLWTTELAGTGVDPTGQTAGQPALAVEFAVPVSSGNPLAPAGPSAWYAAVWLTGSSIRGYVAQCCVGPTGGSPAGQVQLTAGTAFDVWSRILGSPEQPVKFCGTQSVY